MSRVLGDPISRRFAIPPMEFLDLGTIATATYSIDLRGHLAAHVVAKFVPTDTADGLLLGVLGGYDGQMLTYYAVSDGSHNVTVTPDTATVTSYSGTGCGATAGKGINITLFYWNGLWHRCAAQTTVV